MMLGRGASMAKHRHIDIPTESDLLAVLFARADRLQKASAAKAANRPTAKPAAANE
jgi:hypothetical protein